MDLPPITDVISGIDHLVLNSNSPLPDLVMSDFIRGRTLLERAIFEQVVRNESADSFRLEGMSNDALKEWHEKTANQLFPQRTKEDENTILKTVRWLRGLVEAGRRVTLISTNYDIELEQGLYRAVEHDGDNIFTNFDFGTSVREPNTGEIYDRPNAAPFGVYKLHGSLNWLRCDVCDTIYVNPVGPIAYLSFLLDSEPALNEPNTFRRKLWESGVNQCHCGHRPLRHVIIAPSFVREMRDVILVEIWRNALAALRRADTWIIVGYSLPPEDVAVRSILLRGGVGRDPKPNAAVIVVQKNKKEPELSRYQLLFPTHTYVSGGFEAITQHYAVK